MSFADLVAQADDVSFDAFGELVLYQPESGVAVPVTGIFDEQYLLVKGSADAGIESTGPAVFLRLEDLPTDPQDDEPTITIRSVAYRVVERRPDGMGGVVLALRSV